MAQAGLNGTHGSTVYAVDRWIANGCTAEQSTGCLKLTTSRSYAHILQKVTGVAGKTLTCAAKFSGAGVGAIRVYDESITTKYAEVKNISVVGCVAFTVPDDVDTITVLLYPNQESVSSGLIYWAALYEGSYTADTLPSYVPKGKHVEMLNCGVSLAPHNLLDNSDFTNPVNQRGIQSGTSITEYTYCLDRWMNFGTTAGTLTLSENGISFTMTNFSQRLPETIKTGTVVTAAAKWNDGTVVTVTGAITRGNAWTWFTAANNGHQIGVIDMGNNKEAHFTILGGSGVVEWAALYEGSYDASTLPAYQPKGYAAELAECRLYYKVIDINVAPWLLETTTLRRYYVGYEPMRTTPTVDVSGLKEYATWTDLASTMNPYNIKNNRVLISANAETTSTRIYMGGSIALSADL